MNIIKLTTWSLVLCGVILLITNISAQQKDSSSDFPKDGYVPDEKTAIKIAEAIWLPILGKEIYKHKPFRATLKDNEVWIVEGTLHAPRGGVPYAEIQKKDCKIVKVTHYK